jgi:hypothetical protein
MTVASSCNSLNFVGAFTTWFFKRVWKSNYSSNTEPVQEFHNGGAELTIVLELDMYSTLI